MSRPVKRLRDPEELTSEKLAADVKAWIADGNEVRVIPAGVGSELAHPARKYDSARKRRSRGINIKEPQP